MAILPLQLARVSNLLRTNVAGSQIARTQQQLLQAQNEMTTGRRLNSPSDDPGAAAISQQLRKAIERRQAYLGNVRQAVSHLGESDSALADATDLLRQAQSLASANVGSDVTPDERRGAAAVVKAIYGQMLSLANKQFGGVYLFGGDKSDAPPFVEENGGVRFVGSQTLSANACDESTVLPFMVDGSAVFGALSSRVEGTADLTPRMTLDTRLEDLRGANNRGIAPGSIRIGNGSVSAIVNLSAAKSVRDVVNAINAAGIGGITAAIGMGGQRLQVTGLPGETITIDEVAGGSTAADLGIAKNPSGGIGVAVTGAMLQPRLSPFSKLSDLRGGAGIDLVNGMTITNGQQSATISLAGANTVEDLLNAINGAGAGVRAAINDAGDGLNILNATQNTQLTIAEAGGTLAGDLGVRSFHPATPLGELNFGVGVRTVDGADFQIDTADGGSFQVDLSAAADVQDAIDAINAAGGGAVTAGFATSGNGITITDNTAGAGTLRVTPLNFSQAASDLGITQPPVAGTITGADVNAVKAGGVFSDLLKLIDALERGDAGAMTEAAEGLKLDEAAVIRVRAEAGARVQDLEIRQDRLQQQDLATRALLSDLEDTDYTEAIARFQTLQTALEASMKTTGALLRMSLMDFVD